MSTYTPISTILLTSSQSSITFTDIPQNYTDLILYGNFFFDTAVDMKLRFNSDTGNNYTYVRISDTSQKSYNTYIQPRIGAGPYPAHPANYFINLMNYSNPYIFKSILSKFNHITSGGAGNVANDVAQWRSLNPITSITISPDLGNWTANSLFTLYGISSSESSTAKATGGDSIYRDSTYWYHVFTKSGTFTPNQSISNVSYLMVGGGGGGATIDTGTNNASGGGGAGGFLTGTLNLSAVPYPITVGAGGTSSADFVFNGGDTTFNNLIAYGGGFGGFYKVSNAGNPGGSGGGGRVSAAGGGGISGQGNNGGQGLNQGGGGGGGGAGSSGATATTVNGATGGSGIVSSITGTSITYAGGGGGGSAETGTGGAGGSGGGGNGATYNNNASNGVNGLGGGGGGAGGTTGAVRLGGKGGSGIVVLRYTI